MLIVMIRNSIVMSMSVSSSFCLHTELLIMFLVVLWINKNTVVFVYEVNEVHELVQCYA